jgi:DNA-binding NarL/FixJ family response regulator
LLQRFAPHFTKAADLRRRLNLREPDPQTLKKALDLTPAEAKLAIALFKGQTVKEYAYDSRISVSTVRWRVKCILEKLGIHRQADLIRCIRESILGL